MKERPRPTLSKRRRERQYTWPDSYDDYAEDCRKREWEKSEDCNRRKALAEKFKRRGSG